MKRHTMKVHTVYKYYDETIDKWEEVKGWLHNNIFLCMSDSLSKPYPWHAFDATTGEEIKTGTRYTRADALFYAEMRLELNKCKQGEAIPF